MSHAEAIERNNDVLLRCTTINLFVIDFLRAKDVLDEAQESDLKAEKSHFKQRLLLFQWLKEVSSDRYESFLQVMKDAEQKHVANLLTGSNEGDHLPLLYARYTRLVKIRPTMAYVTQIDNEVIAELRSLRAISMTDAEEIRAETVDYAKVSKLISAIMRRSNYSFNSFREVLRKTLQTAAAEYLEEGEMPAVHINSNRPDLDEPLSLALNGVIRNNNQDDTKAKELLADLNGLSLNPVRAIPGQSIVIFIYCKTVDSAVKFTQLYNSGRLHNILERILKRLLLTIEPQNTNMLSSVINLEDEEILTLEKFSGIEGWMIESSKRYKPSIEIRRCDASTQTDLKEDKPVKKWLSVIVECFPHVDVFEHDFNCDFRKDQALCVKRIDYLENFQSRDADHFWRDMSRSNYLTMLYFNCSTPKLAEAMRQNDETLRRDPGNLNALWCRSKIFLHQKKYPEVKYMLQRMENLLTDSVHMVTAKAELGVIYPDLGPAFYQKSIQLLETVLQELSSIPNSEKSDVLRSRTIKWTFDLVHTYNSLMNKGTIQSYWDDSTESRPKHEVLFKRIKELFWQVTASGDLQYTAGAWIELGDAYKKYEEEVPQRERTESLPDGMTVDNCFENALELGPDDVFVLERCGRHYRQRATDILELETAIDFLKRCIERDPYHDVAHHHMGLAYRSVWLEMEDHEEARIHTNRTKRHGEKRSIEKQISISSQASNSKPRSFNQKTPNAKGSCVCNTTDAKRGSGFTSAAYSRSMSDAGVSLGSRYDNPHGNSAQSKPRISEPATPIRFHDTIPPKYKKREREVPKHYRKPDYYDKLRSGNPIAKDPEHIYLMETRSCFQKASDLRQGACCRYLVDLARTYISTGDLTTAEALFVQASHCDYSSNDGAYLYEQWGLMAEREVEEFLKEDVNEYRPIDRVKNFFRKAMRFSAESMGRSRIGFYRLRDIIYSQIQDNPSDISILQKEHLLLYTTMQDAKRAQEVLDNMKSEESIVLMWQLVNLFRQRNRPEDPDSAFTYLALLANARKLREPVDLDKDLEDVLLERIGWVIQISERRVRRNGGGRTRETLTKVFEWLVTLCDGDIPISAKRSKDKYMVCILAPSSETPSVAEVMTVLTDVIGVEILQGFVENSPDLPLGKSILEEIENMVRRVRNVVVVMQMVGAEMSSDELQMLHILKPLTNHPHFATKRFCRVVTSEHQAIEYDTLDVHPKWNLDEVDKESDPESTQLAFGLLRALFASWRN